jgi:hypothetical protein
MKRNFEEWVELCQMWECTLPPIQFPRSGLGTLEVPEVSCCELSHPLIECLLGRECTVALDIYL